MKDRLLEFLKAENKSSAQFADEIGVQPSGISHILSGRNNPSLDFVLKMLEKYRFISTDWLLFGKGSMYKDSKMQTLFDEDIAFTNKIEVKPIINEPSKSDNEMTLSEKEVLKESISPITLNKKSNVRKIVWFYDNNSFEEYYPGS
jgi:transcriptional regulator with XRE-family HTH domain